MMDPSNTADNTAAQDDGMRKAAIVLTSLDRASADAMLKALDPEQARRVRQMAVSLGAIDPKEQRRVIDEFFRNGPAPRRQGPSGIELDDSLAEKLSMPQVHTALPVRPHSACREAQPFQFLHDAEAGKLAQVLNTERPQTIALVLSHLSPDTAGNVLARFPAALQVQVVQRLVDLEETDPEILREVERALHSRLSQQVPMQRRRVAGVHAVVGILEAADSQVGLQILDNLATCDQALAERLSPESIQFDDLMRLDDDELVTVFRAAGSALTMTALVGAPPELIDRVVSQLPTSEAEKLRRQFDHPGPIRLQDLEAARQRIAEIAGRLSMQRRIHLPNHQPALA
ncbi:MAG: hypothetical protein JXB62_20990 [Pirellulales bacterium]|nr:hypothetical protein [Pirellulales bacterium]